MVARSARMAFLAFGLYERPVRHLDKGSKMLLIANKDHG
jgi:hypothetical protein